MSETVSVRHWVGLELTIFLLQTPECYMEVLNTKYNE